MVQSRWWRSILALLSGLASIGILMLAWTLVRQAPGALGRDAVWLGLWTLVFVALIPAGLLMLPVGFCSARLWKIYHRHGRPPIDEDDP